MNCAKAEGIVARTLKDLHDRYHNRMMAVAGALCRGAAWLDPRDLVQEAFLRFFERGGGAERNDAGGWLIRVLCNHFYDLMRKRKYESAGAEDPTLAQRTHGHEQVPSTYENVAYERFEEAIGKLPEKQRVAFLLHVGGKRNQEIARMLGTTANTVGKRLFDARQKLHQLLEAYANQGVQ